MHNQCPIDVMNQDHYQRRSQPQSDARAHIFYVATHFVVVNYWHISSYVHLLAKTFHTCIYQQILFAKCTARLS